MPFPDFPVLLLFGEKQVQWPGGNGRECCEHILLSQVPLSVYMAVKQLILAAP